MESQTPEEEFQNKNQNQNPQNLELSSQNNPNPLDQNSQKNPKSQEIISSNHSHIPTPKNQIPEVKEAIIGNENGNNPIFQYQLQIPKGTKTIICWNCLSTLMVKEEWEVVECTTCHKYNRVPNSNYEKPYVSYVNDNMTNFDIGVPSVFGIVTCPFCHTENRFRKDTNHIVCYKCHHSFNVKDTNGHFIEDYVPNYQMNNIGNGYNLQRGFDGNRVLRFSDFFSPDIMFWKGYYPQPYVVNTCSCQNNRNWETEYLLKKMINEIKKQNKSYTPYIPIDRYSYMRNLVRDVDNIQDKQVDRYLTNMRNDFDEGRKFLERDKNGINGNLYRSRSGIKKKNPYDNRVYVPASKSQSINRMFFNY